MQSKGITSSAASQPVHMGPTHARQTARPTSPFKETMRATADVLLAGAETATAVVGMPVLSAALHSTRQRTSRPNPQITSASYGIRHSSELALSAPSPTASPLALTGHPPSEEMELLQMQAQIQAHNRHITMVSNIMKAEHDTRKAAVSNMRA